MIRYLEANDFDRGFFECLSALKPSQMSRDDFENMLHVRITNGIETAVMIDDDVVIGTASWIIEPKFLHGGSNVVHVEDVAVLKERQGEGIGRQLMDYIIGEAQAYKLILDCSEHNVPFYEKCGLHRDGVCMRVNF